MITLNTDHELKTIETWQEIIEMPGFTTQVDPKTITLKEIIGSYKFSDRVRCGLATCRQPHGSGFLVTTNNGLITNIGQVCGKQNFLVTFETMRKRYEHDTENKRRREAILDGQFKISGWRQQISDLRSGEVGVDWAHKATRPLILPSKAISQKVRQVLLECVRNRDGSLFTDRKATKAERDIAEAVGDKPTGPMFIREKIGEIKGIRALFPEHDLRRLLVDELEPLINELETSNPDTMPYRALGTLSKRIANIDSAIDSAREAFRLHQTLLTSPNLEQLLQLIDVQEERAAFSAYIKTLPKS